MRTEEGGATEAHVRNSTLIDVIQADNVNQTNPAATVACHSSRSGVGSSSAAPIPHSMSQPCLPVSNLGPTRILPFLFLGSQADSLCQETMMQNGISYVLSVSTSSPKPPFIQERHYLRLPVNDTYSDRLTPFFSEAFQFIDKVREGNGCVLIHCLAGISRSPTIAIAYIMSILNMTTDEAYRYVKAKRPTVSPNFNFLGQLVEFEHELNEMRRSTKELSDKNISFGSDSITGCELHGRLKTAEEYMRNRCQRATLDFALTCAYKKFPISSSVRMNSTMNASLKGRSNSMLSLSVTSPTSALADLTFCHLSPLEEQSSSPSLEGNSGTVPMIYTSQAPVMGPHSSVVIRLGPKHCGASKRPLSSPGNCGLAEDKSTATNSDTSTSEGGTSTKRRPLARPNSISVVPIVSANDQISPNFGSFSWLTATGSQRSASQIVPSINFSKSNDNFASKCMDSAHSNKYFPELCFNIAKTQEGSILPDENSTNVVTNWGSNALDTLEFCNKTSVTCPSIALDPSAKSRKQIRPDGSMILPDTFVFSPFAQKHIEFLTDNFCAAVPNSNKVTASRILNP